MSSLTKRQRRSINKKYKLEADRDNALWPHCSIKAYKYARRRLQRMEQANGSIETAFEYCLIMDDAFSRFINNNKNW